MHDAAFFPEPGGLPFTAISTVRAQQAAAAATPKDLARERKADAVLPFCHPKSAHDAANLLEQNRFLAASFESTPHAISKANNLSSRSTSTPFPTTSMTETRSDTHAAVASPSPLQKQRARLIRKSAEEQKSISVKKMRSNRSANTSGHYNYEDLYPAGSIVAFRFDSQLRLGAVKEANNQKRMWKCSLSYPSKPI
jgi:hypothetical protein